jgi:tetratricopeptide (TPR) repeat protein
LANGNQTAQISIEVPLYLFSPAGKAYHHTALSPESGIDLYQEAYGLSTSQQWLAAKLATEQQKLRIIPKGAIEPAFLHGMVLYREGDRAEAEQVLRQVAYSPEERIEVAIAAHIVGRSLWRTNAHEAEKLLRRSLKIGEALGNQHHQAQVLHTLGQNLWRTNAREAEQLLRRSLKMLETLGDRYGQAQVLHTLGQKLWQTNAPEAEQLLRRSLEIGEALRNQHHQAQVLYTLGKSLWPSDHVQGEALLLKSLEINRRANNRGGEQIVIAELRRRGIPIPRS